MGRFSLGKSVAKGVEGAIIAGASAGSSLALQGDSDEIETALVTLLAAAVGFVFRVFRNWLKNRNR